MADLDTHVAQARHNQECARSILDMDADARDWAITATFYSAVHLAEACFTKRSDIGHTESAPDRRSMEMHKYRKKKIEIIAPHAYKSYQKLFVASCTVRYLPMDSPEGSQTSLKYYSEADAKRMLEVDLPNLRTELQSAFKVPLD